MDLPGECKRKIPLPDLEQKQLLIQSRLGHLCELGASTKMTKGPSQAHGSLWLLTLPMFFPSSAHSVHLTWAQEFSPRMNQSGLPSFSWGTHFLNQLLFPQGRPRKHSETSQKMTSHPKVYSHLCWGKCFPRDTTTGTPLGEQSRLGECAFSYDFHDIMAPWEKDFHT